MTFNQIIRFIALGMVLLLGFVPTSIAQFGDYSVNIRVDNFAQGVGHDSYIIFADNLGGTTSVGWDQCCDAYALPPALGQPMIYTEITDAPFPSGGNEIQYNSRPPLTADWTVPLGFYTGAGSIGTYTLEFNWLNTIPGNIGIELEDILLSTTQDLLVTNTYTYSGTHSDSEARFLIHFTFSPGGCDVPDTPITSSVSTDGFDVSWTCGSCSGGEAFIVEYGLSGFVPGTTSSPGLAGTVINPALSTESLTGLLSSQAYDVYVRSDCGGTFSSNTAVVTETTLTPPCLSPDAPIASAITSDGFDVSWTCGSCSGGESFVLEYGLSGFTPGLGGAAGAGGTVINPALSTESISGLLSNETYDFYVRSDCGGTYSLNTSIVSETTLPPPCSTPDAPVTSVVTTDGFDVSWTCGTCSGGETFVLEYGLSGFTPGTGAIAGAGGIVVNPASSTESITGLLHSELYDVYLRSNCGVNFSANTPVVSELTLTPPCETPDVPATGGLTTDGFDIFWTCGSCVGGETFVLEYGLSGFTPGTEAIAGIGGTVINPASSAETLFGLMANETYDIYIRTDCGGYYSLNTAVVSETTLPLVCATPEDPTTSVVTLDGFDVSWTCTTCSGGESFVMEYGLSGFTPGIASAPGVGGTVISPAFSTESISGLPFNTTYDVYVRSKCIGSFSPNTAIVSETTLAPPCEIPDAPTTSAVTIDGFDVSWTCTGCSGGETFVLEYGLSGFTPGSGATAGTGGTVINPASSTESLSGLLSSQGYDVYVRTDCGGSYSANTGVVSETTLTPPCSPADAPTTSTVTIDGFDVSWTCTGCSGGETFVLEYGLSGFTPGAVAAAGTGGTVINPAASTESLSGLLSSQGYDVYVRTDCGGTYSLNTGVVTETTLTPPCSPADAPTTSAVTIDGFDVSWTCTGCSGGETFVLEYGLSGFTPGTGATAGTGGTVINPASSTESLSGLLSSQGYDVYVRTDCGGTYSANTGVVSATTAGIPCVADFSIGGATTCVNTNVAFTDVSVGASTWLWDFGDGTTSTMQNPVHVYENIGDFDVTLTITDGGACGDNTTVVSAVSVSAPLAAFNGNPLSGSCTPHTVFFTDMSTLPDEWDWDFGDGNTSTVQNPVHNYVAEGDFDVLLTVTDNVSGCTDTATTMVSIDVAAPIINSCPAPEVVAGCNFTVPVYSGFSVTDNCGYTISYSQSVAPGTVLVANASIWVYASNGFKSDSCEVPVSFTGSLTAGCQPTTVSLDGSGNGSITFDAAANADQGSASSNGSTTNVLHYQSFQAGQNGIINQVDVNIDAITMPAAVTLNIYQGVGNGGTLLHSQPVNAITGALSILVTDIVQLTSGSDYTFELTVAGGGNISLLRDSSDPYGDGDSQVAGTDLLFGTHMLLLPSIESGSVTCQGIAGVSLSQSSFTCSDVGSVNVDMTLTDHTGNTSTCTASVTVEDNIPPTSVCQIFTVNIDETGNATITAADVDGGSTDNCGTPTLSVSPDAFTCANLGANTVTLTATDGAGATHTCTTTVTVEDNNPPTALCQNLTVYLDGTGNVSITAGDVDAGSTTGCGTITSLSLDVNSFTCNETGANTVTLTVEDSNTNSATCTSIVTVVDTITPTITSCPTNITLCAINPNGVIHTFSLPTGTDNCVVNVNQVDVTGLSSGSVFPPGTTTLIYELSDDDGNSTTCSFDVEVLPAPVADFSFTPACLGENMFFTDESTIDLSGTIVSWLWDMGDGSGAISIVDPTHVYAAVGTYTVTLTVESSDGCSDTFSTTVTVTEVPVADFSATTECQGTATDFTDSSTIDPAYTGGLNYDWNFGDGNSSTDQNPSHAYTSNGTYTVTLTVTTDDGCMDMISNSVVVLDQPAALFVYSETCIGDATDFTDLSVGSGLSFDWNFGDTNTSTDQHPTHIYTNAGSYTTTLTVTNGDGCSHSVSMSVLVSDYPTVGFSFSNACEETSVAFTNTSDAGTYAWDFGNLNSSILSDPSNTYLNAGTYDVTLTVTNANGCVDQLTQQVEIFDNPEFTLTASDVLCFGDSTGSILVSPTVGAAPLDFIMDGGAPQVGSTFGDLFTGLYTVTITDFNGCSTSDDVTVGQPAAALGVGVNGLTDILCHGDTSGSVDVTGTGGTNPYTYSLNGGTGQGNGIFSGLMAGTHDLNITDNNGCMFDTTLTLTEPDSLVLMLDSLANLMCNGDSSGWIDVAGSGGVMPYEYSIDGINFDLPDLFNTLSAGAYLVTVLDANGCTDTLSLELTEPGVLMLSLLGTTDALCNAQASGSVSVAASSGTAPYQYSIDGGVNWQASGDFPGIGAGTYSVIVMDANGCSTEIGAFVAEPSLLTIATSSTPVLCVGDSTGSINIVAGGGTPGYIYSIDGGGSYQTTTSYSGLPAGMYVTVVQDSLGCTASESVVISQPTNALFGSALIQSILCFGDSTGIIQVQATGGTGSYTYSIDAGANWQVVNSFENLTAGTYEIIVQDINGCTFTVEAEVEGPIDPLTIQDVIITQPSCPGDADGTFAIQATGGTAPYQYSSNGGTTYITSSMFTGATAGSYDLMVMDDNGCLASQTLSLMDPDSMVLAVDSIIKVNCEGDSDGLIYVSATGGSGTITYQLNGAAPQATGEFNAISSGVYTIVATDSAGCSSEVTIDATANNPLPDPNFTYIVAGETVAFTNTSLNGNSYSWDFGDGVGTSTDEDPTYSYDNPGNYEVTLSVTNDCGTVDTTITVSTIFFGVEDITLVQGLNIYPNPSSGAFALSFNLSEHVDEFNIQVFDARGRSVYNQSSKDLSGKQNMSISLEDASKGVYRLRLIAGDFSQTLRIVIAK
jgi:PKD repeat protein